MKNRSVFLVLLFGVMLGLVIGIFDSVMHRIGLESNRIANLLVFVFFFIGIYGLSSYYRERICKGFLNYNRAFKITFSMGIAASAIVSAIRMVYLKYIFNVDLAEIVANTRSNMINHYELYPAELIENRLRFIEFSYDPIVSAVLYFTYYSVFALFFGLIISLFIRRVDRNISIY